MCSVKILSGITICYFPWMAPVLGKSNVYGFFQISPSFIPNEPSWPWVICWQGQFWCRCDPVAHHNLHKSRLSSLLLICYARVSIDVYIWLYKTVFSWLYRILFPDISQQMDGWRLDINLEMTSTSTLVSVSVSMSENDSVTGEAGQIALSKSRLSIRIFTADY